MEKATKNCPYCGEEILEVAKKCRHCGEWLEHPEAQSRTGLFKGADYTGMLPVSTILFGLNVWLGVLAPLTIIYLIVFGFGTIFIPWIVSLAVAILFVGTGLKKSHNLTDSEGTVSTLRCWFATQVALAWWPANIIICIFLCVAGIFRENSGYLGGVEQYPTYMIVSWILMVFAGIVIYKKKYRGESITTNDIAKPFVWLTLVENLLIIFFIYIMRFEDRFILPEL